jgi:iron(II)-dependent oxidoreductase
MSGNVWEWTASLWGQDISTPEFKYPYNPRDGRENLKAGDDLYRVLRGGSFGDRARLVRAAFRTVGLPDGWFDVGFRVVLAPWLG